MIFQQVQEVRTGRKTQTRRVVKANEEAIHDEDGNIVEVGRLFDSFNTPWRAKWRVGSTYAIVPKRGHKAIPDGRIRILSIRQERLDEITEEAAIAEGVGCIADYRSLWESINTRRGVRWQDNPRIWVVEFEYVEAKPA